MLSACVGRWRIILNVRGQQDQTGRRVAHKFDVGAIWNQQLPVNERLRARVSIWARRARSAAPFVDKWTR